MNLPEVVLRKDPQILAALVAAKRYLAPNYGSSLSPFLCHAVQRASVELGYDPKEITEAMLKALGTHENGYAMTAGDFFRKQAEDLSANDCQALRHRWLDQLIKEQL